MLAVYSTALERAPLLVKMLTCGALNGLEEIVAQRLNKTRKGPVDWVRVKKMVLYGLCINGPLGHLLYGLMERGLARWQGLVGVVPRLLIVNLVIIPIVTAVYLYALGVIAELPRHRIQQRIRRDFQPIMVTTLKYFPIIQVGTFVMLPQHLWVPWFNLIGFLFGVYVNYSAASAPASLAQ
eukprot:a677832_30.p1 GENE.a677832_30~~a677832_30.p1  ORF type:complete len:212 (-),score=36.98 a677832_30:10-552(-)